jgi:hypothetical protein
VDRSEQEPTFLRAYVVLFYYVPNQNKVFLSYLILISRDFPLQLSKCLADSDLVVIGLTGIGPIRKISVLAQ